MTATQKVNMEMVDLLRAFFVDRLENGFAWSRLASMHQMLPGLRGFWPLGSRDENGDCYDLSGQGRTLTNNSATAFGLKGFVPYAIHDGSADYLSRADEAGLDLTGSLSGGCWVNPNAIPGATNEGILCKWNTTGNQRAYRTMLTTTGALTLQVSNAGVAVDGIVTSTTLTSAGTWYFMGFRYTAGSEVAIWVDDEKTIDTTTIPIAVFNSTSALELGSFNGGAASRVLDGFTALPFLCDGALPDYFFRALYEYSRAAFGKV